MAIIPAVPGVSVCVRVGGQVAEEHAEPHAERQADGSTESSCYIESSSGTEFSVECTVDSAFKCPPSHNALCFRVFVDGFHVAARVLHRQRDGTVQGTLNVAEFTTRLGNGTCMKSNLVFASVSIDENESDAEILDPTTLGSLGTIKVEISTAIKGRRTKAKVRSFKEPSLNLSEKAAKGRALSHSVCLSAARKAVKYRALSVHDERTLGTVYFHYRSHESLRTLCVIRNSPSPTDEAVESNVESKLENKMAALSEAEIRRLAMKQLREMEAETSAGVKREADATQLTPQPFKIVKLEDGREAMDLTEE